jgi:hypothetical protein
MQFSRHPSTSSSSSSSSLSSSSFPNNVRNPNRTYIPNHIHVPSAPVQEQFYAGQNHFYQPQEVASAPLRNGAAYANHVNHHHHQHHHSRTMPRHPPSYNNRFHYPSPIQPNGVVYGGGGAAVPEHAVAADQNLQHYSRISQSSQYLPQIHQQDGPHPHPHQHSSPVLRDILPDNPVLKFHGSVGKEIDV